MVITSTSTINNAGVGRARGQPNGYVGETELAKLIRYGCQFELQVHQMVELSQMRTENAQLRRKVEEEAEAPAQVEDLVARTPNPTQGKRRARRAGSGAAWPDTG